MYGKDHLIFDDNTPNGAGIMGLGRFEIALIVCDVCIVLDCRKLPPAASSRMRYFSYHSAT